ncbi:PPOX class F420-dependent oxidoreductase [Natribaculum luteum]|uniref:PPOX class F420-dependent oxidoreductase n=1 Tax=Natribaculum luteum TaxID=1586232 RepID=A0ABD5NXF9_9EURY|nr:PPOX class F420-dependent oxidoreductase [Natribaculum luteum]
MEEIPPEHRDLFDRKTFAQFATVMPDGTPHVTPVWVDVDDDGYVLVNTVRNRRKEKNVRRESKVGLSIPDPDDPYRYLSIRGEVVEVTTDGAVEHIDDLARRYMDVEEYPNHDAEDEDRVIVRIRPDRIVASGG